VTARSLPKTLGACVGTHPHVTWLADGAIGQLPRGCYWDGLKDARFNVNVQSLTAAADADEPERGAICNRTGPPLVLIGYVTILTAWGKRMAAESDVCAELAASIR
jgi:hypothetical protein